MKALIVTPEPAALPLGNSITAMRWAAILRTLGHHVDIARSWSGEDCDLLIALHAQRSRPSIEQFRHSHPLRPLILALTGTDLYRDLRLPGAGHLSLELATRIVGLQEAACNELDDDARAKTTIIYQSAAPPPARREPDRNYFDVCVLSHLRAVKDPLRAAYAARLLPLGSRVRITHAGRSLEPEWEEQVRTEESANPRYRWIGEQPHARALELLASSRLLILSSRIEGGASAIAEAVMCGVPVLCSDIPGNIGMLGPDYPGYFRLSDTEQLADLLNRAETDPNFFAAVEAFVNKLQPRFAPEQERASWARLLAQL